MKPRKKKAGRGELLLCGLGIDRPAETTLATIEALKSCDVAFYIHGDGEAMKAFLAPFCADVRLFDSRELEAMGDAGRARFVGDAVCAELERGRRVAYVTYGHPSLYSDAGNVAQHCLGRGHRFRVLPAVSSIDGIIAALHAQEGGSLGQGFLACLADQVLGWDEPGRPDVAWILLGVDRLVKRGQFASLCEKIRRWYPPEHKAWAVRCAEGRGEGVLEAGTVADLRGWESRIQHMMSLVLAPGRGPGSR